MIFPGGVENTTCDQADLVGGSSSFQLLTVRQISQGGNGETYFLSLKLVTLTEGTK